MWPACTKAAENEWIAGVRTASKAYSRPLTFYLNRACALPMLRLVKRHAHQLGTVLVHAIVTLSWPCSIRIRLIIHMVYAGHVDMRLSLFVPWLSWHVSVGSKTQGIGQKIGTKRGLGHVMSPCWLLWVYQRLFYTIHVLYKHIQS